MGISGRNGTSVLSGNGAPSGASLNPQTGDFYIDTSGYMIYGPWNGNWEAGTSLVGPQGAAGATGPAGSQGIQGPPGPTAGAAATVTDVNISGPNTFILSQTVTPAFSGTLMMDASVTITNGTGAEADFSCNYLVNENPMPASFMQAIPSGDSGTIPLTWEIPAPLNVPQTVYVLCSGNIGTTVHNADLNLVVVP